MTDGSVRRGGKRRRGAETVAAVQAAVAAGATSWADVGRRVGVSRVRVSQIAAELAAAGRPLALVRPSGREVTLTVRCHGAAVRMLDAQAQLAGVDRSAMVRTLLAEALAARVAEARGAGLAKSAR